MGRLGEPVPRLGKARTLDKVDTWPLHSLEPLVFVLPWMLARATQLTWNMESSSPCGTLACCHTGPTLQGKLQIPHLTRVQDHTESAEVVSKEVGILL